MTQGLSFAWNDTSFPSSLFLMFQIWASLLNMPKAYCWKENAYDTAECTWWYGMCMHKNIWKMFSEMLTVLILQVLYYSSYFFLFLPFFICSICLNFLQWIHIICIEKPSRADRGVQTDPLLVWSWICSSQVPCSLAWASVSVPGSQRCREMNLSWSQVHLRCSVPHRHDPSCMCVLISISSFPRNVFTCPRCS